MCAGLHVSLNLKELAFDSFRPILVEVYCALLDKNTIPKFVPMHTRFSLIDIVLGVYLKHHADIDQMLQCKKSVTAGILRHMFHVLPPIVYCYGTFHQTDDLDAWLTCLASAFRYCCAADKGGYAVTCAQYIALCVQFANKAGPLAELLASKLHDAADEGTGAERVNSLLRANSRKGVTTSTELQRRARLLASSRGLMRDEVAAVLSDAVRLTPGSLDANITAAVSRAESVLLNMVKKACDPVCAHQDVLRKVDGGVVCPLLSERETPHSVVASRKILPPGLCSVTMNEKEIAKMDRKCDMCELSNESIGDNWAVLPCMHSFCASCHGGKGCKICADVYGKLVTKKLNAAYKRMCKPLLPKFKQDEKKLGGEGEGGGVEVGEGERDMDFEGPGGVVGGVCDVVVEDGSDDFVDVHEVEGEVDCDSLTGGCAMDICMERKRSCTSSALDDEECGRGRRRRKVREAYSPPPF